MDRHNYQLFGIIVVGLLAVLAACTPPTPPPSPTPWLNATPVPTVGSSPTPQAASTTVFVSTPQAIPSPRPTLSVGEGPSTITVWESLPEAQTQQLNQDIEAFEAEFPRYRIELKHYDGSESFMSPLMADQIAFDVVLASPVLLGNLWRADQLAPMSDFFSAAVIDNFVAVTLEGATRNDEVWGLPDTAGFHLLLFYNQALVDTPPADTSELRELAETLTAGSRWGLGLNSYDPLWLVPWLAASGGWLTNEAGQPTLNTPAMESALRLFLGWQGRLTGVAPVATYQEVRTKFLNGDVAMVIDGEWAIGELANTNKIEWGVALLPEVIQAQDSPPPAPLVLARYWAVSPDATGSQAQAAAAFLTFVTRPERQLAWTEQFGLLPTRREVLDDPQIVSQPIMRINAAQMQAGRTVPLGVNVNALLEAMRDPLRAVIDGEATPREAAEMMQENVER